MPLLCREVDVLWQALCPAYFWVSPIQYISFKPKTEPSRRCLSSHPQNYDAQIRKVLDSQYSKRGERAERYRRARDFFLRSRNARLISPDCTITNSQKARRSRDKSFFTGQDASFNTFADTSKASRSIFGLHELAARWVPSAFKRNPPVSIPQKERSDYKTEIKDSSEEPSVDNGGLNESLNEIQSVEKNQERPDERPQELMQATVNDSLLAISEDYGVLSKPKQIPMQEKPLELERPSPGVKTASPRRPQETRQSELSSDVLYEKLRKVSATGDYIRIHEILRTLIEERGEQPNRRHYQAMLLGNTNAQHGSPAEVAHILQQMEAEGISLDSAAYHAIIKVLAIHPDYLLRRHVLEELRERWFNLSDEGWQDVIVGLLRDKQLEVAIETLQNVQQEGIRIQPWLYDLVLFNLCEGGEYDEALSMLRFRIDRGEQVISGNVWHHVLDSASRAFHHEATFYAWRKRVETSYLNPSSGVCLNVLDTAARHGDSRLATDVIRVLGNRSQKLQRYHYEALIESYLPSDLQTALTVLTLMASSRIRPTESSTRAIFLHLQQSSDLPESAIAILRDLKQQQRLIPVEAVNVIIESHIYHERFDTALETYKMLHTLCPSGAVTGTFNTLFRGCRSRKEIAMFLASEMVAMKVPPNALTYDRLVLVCVEASSTKEDLTDAWRYVEEMRGGGWWLRLGTAKALAKKACALGDERIWDLQGDPNEDGGLDKVSLRRMVEEEWKGEKGSMARYDNTEMAGTESVHDVFLALKQHKAVSLLYENVIDFCTFFYSSFMKPHSQNEGSGQQAALESFYKVQANVYDATRKRLLCGREDMLALVAAQLKFQARQGRFDLSKPVWVDVGGGTGYNIEAMHAHLDVPTFFAAVFLVDLSPSLCDVARKRFDRLGWDVKVICEDARTFRLEDHLGSSPSPRSATGQLVRHVQRDANSTLSADVITMSYSLSMIPDYYNVVDSLVTLLAPTGIIGVVDFYVQSIVETSGRNYVGGSFNRHVNWLSRVFWRAWFDCDRVGLEGARRDYLEYRFGTKKTLDERNYLLGGIPYYIFLGCHCQGSFKRTQELLDMVDASCTESPQLIPASKAHDLVLPLLPQPAIPMECRSKAYESAVVNLSSNLPLPSTFYQNHQARIYYEENLKKHTQFNHDYLYAFAWEDPKVDQRLLQINDNDTILCLTSGGDNLLEYLVTARPRRIHAVDLNPNQNHLLELKIAAFQALHYADVWKLFGEGHHPDFQDLLINKLSPHMSSQAFQFWFKNVSRFTSSNSFYEYGGSGCAIKLVRWLAWLTGLKQEIRRLCNSKTRNEQREVWSKIRPMILSRSLHWALVGTEWFLWKAAGVPPAQRQLIIQDASEQPQKGSAPPPEGLSDTTGEAMWDYIVNTLDPVAQHTLLSEENYHYLLTLTGQYTRRCHPVYLSPKAHTKLSQPNAFSNLRIHTDELSEIIQRFKPATLTIAIVRYILSTHPTPLPPALPCRKIYALVIKLELIRHNNR
ncbi:MAG: hypothetical protein LQ350_006112 [Teloschistes chrysophthalmus]|nr:MAG: hypothetical protein LQ350_006112 [Niorma chrysophthalma]